MYVNGTCCFSAEEQPIMRPIGAYSSNDYVSLCKANRRLSPCPKPDYVRPQPVLSAEHLIQIYRLSMRDAKTTLTTNNENCQSAFI
jgi:hypothetical protein